MSPADEVLLGEVVGVFGIRGEVRLLLHHRESRLLDRARPVRLAWPDGRSRSARLSARPGAGKRILGRLEGVDTPEAAEGLVGAAVWIARSELPAPEPGEYYVHDLLGARVEDEDGAVLGTVDDVVTGPIDVWTVTTPSGPGFLVAERDVVLEVDVAGRRVVVRRGAVETG